MESTLQIMPVQRISRNFGEYAEEAVIIEEPVIKQKRPLFIEANTIEASLEHLRNDCIIPVFAKDNEATLSHVAFIEAVQDATNTFFSGEQIESPDIRVSHHSFSDLCPNSLQVFHVRKYLPRLFFFWSGQIGRASCRERV